MNPNQHSPARYQQIRPWFYPAVLLLTAVLSLTACFRDERGQAVSAHSAKNQETSSAATELLTVSIPSVVSKDKLEITLPRCFFNISKDEENEIANHRVEMKAVSILYPLATFSDFPNNENNISQCPDFNQPITGIGIGPIYPVKINEHNLAYRNYWLKQLWFSFKLKEQRNNQAIYWSGSGGKLSVFANHSDISQEDIWIDFWPYKSDNNSFPTFESQIGIQSVLDKEFNIDYTVYASPIFHDSNPPIKGAKFADDLLAIYKKNESLLDHPEILNGFVNNNNKIINYLNQHSKVITPSAKQKTALDGKKAKS